MSEPPIRVNGRILPKFTTLVYACVNKPKFVFGYHLCSFVSRVSDFI